MHRRQLKHPQLCLVTDPDKPDLVQRVEQALAAGVTMLQLRGHALSSAHLYALAKVLRPLCQRYQAIFIVNDRVDVGLAIGADGLQLGTHSLPLPVVRQLVGDRFLLGASVHAPEEACAAVNAGADFLLVGTMFASPSHPGEPPSGPQLLRTLRNLGLTLPLFAIGGITGQNGQQVMQAGANGIAVISAIFDAENIAYTVRELLTSMTYEVHSHDE